MSANTLEYPALTASPDTYTELDTDAESDSDSDDDSDPYTPSTSAGAVEDDDLDPDPDTILGATGDTMVEITVRQLLTTPEDASAIASGFQFGKPTVSFGPVPWALYDTLYSDPEYDAPTPYEPLTGATTADLRHLWSRLGFAKEPGATTMRAKLSWEMDALKCSDSDIEAMRPMLEHHYAHNLPAKADALLAY